MDGGAGAAGTQSPRTPEDTITPNSLPERPESPHYGESTSLFSSLGPARSHGPAHAAPGRDGHSSNAWAGGTQTVYTVSRSGPKALAQRPQGGKRGFAER